MELNKGQYEKIAKHLSRQRGNVSMSNLQLVNAILDVAENGCKWRALQKRNSDGRFLSYWSANRGLLWKNSF